MYYNVLKDENFRNGFKIKGTDSQKDGHICRKIMCGNGKVPSWFLCQWNTKYDLLDDGVAENVAGGYHIFDASKSLTVKDGGKTLVFSLKAEKEYDHPRKPSEPWPHLLLEQDIEPFVRVGDVDTIRVKGRFELLGFTDYMDEAAEEHHTAQFVWVMVFRNVNERSSDFGRFMWVVMGIFDSRYEVMPLYCAQDNAMPDGEFIYSFSSADYLDGRLKTGVPQDVDFDVYPRLKEIFARARSAGYLTHTAFEDLALTGMNFGFEITGTFSAAISVKQPELIVKEK